MTSETQIQPTPDQTYARLVEHFTEYARALDHYTDAQFEAKPSPEAWSLGQLYEHLLASARGLFGKKISACLTHQYGQVGGEMNERGQQLFANDGFPPIKIRPPEQYRGPDPVAQSRDAYRVAFAQVVADLESQVERMAHDDGTYKAGHAVFGMLNAHEWLRAFEMHTRHHFRQKAELDTFLKQTQ